LDLRQLDPERVRTRFPRIHATCLRYGVDITRDLVPVTPAAHYVMGGVATDLHGRTTLPGLFAAGEVAGTGVHGANRLASNSLLEGLVFGARAAEAMAAEPAVDVTVENVPAPSVSAIAGVPRDTIRSRNWLGLGLERDAARLGNLLEFLAGLRATAPPPSDR